MGSPAVESLSGKSPTSSLRRVNKPLVEKKRRARINGCLGKLKELILTATKTEDANVSRLEKADILEMTVNYLRHKQNQNGTTDIKQEPEVATKFQDGYTECAEQVFRYMNSLNGLTPDVRAQLEGHLVGRLRGSASTPVTSAVNSTANPSMICQSTQMSEQLSNVNELTAHYQTAVDLANMSSMHSAPTNMMPTQQGVEGSRDCIDTVYRQDSRPDNQSSTPVNGNHVLIDTPTIRSQSLATHSNYTRQMSGSEQHINDSSMSTFCTSNLNQGHYNKNNVAGVTNSKHSHSGYDIPDYHKPLHIDIPESPPLSMSPSPQQLQSTRLSQHSDEQVPGPLHINLSAHVDSDQDEASTILYPQQYQQWSSESLHPAERQHRVTESTNSYNVNYSRANQCIMMNSNVTNSSMYPSDCYSSNIQYSQGNFTSHNMHHLPPTPSPPTLMREEIPYGYNQSNVSNNENQRNPLTCLQNYCNSSSLIPQTNMQQSTNNLPFEQHPHTHNRHNSYYQSSQTKPSSTTTPVSLSKSSYSIHPNSRHHTTTPVSLSKSSYSLHPNSHHHLDQQNTNESNVFDQRFVDYKERENPRTISSCGTPLAHTLPRGGVPIMDKTNNNMRMNDQRTSADESYSRINNPLSPPTLKKRILFGKRSEVSAGLTDATLARVQAERLGQTDPVTNLNRTKAALNMTKESVLYCEVVPEMGKVSTTQGHTQGKIDEHLWRPW